MDLQVTLVPFFRTAELALVQCARAFAVKVFRFFLAYPVPGPVRTFMLQRKVYVVPVRYPDVLPDEPDPEDPGDL